MDLIWEKLRLCFGSKRVWMYVILLTFTLNQEDG